MEITREDFEWAKQTARWQRRSKSLAIDLDMVEGAALEGLTKAARDFDPSRGVDFRVYARQRVIGTILDELRRADHLTRDERQFATHGITRRGAVFEMNTEHPVHLNWFQEDDRQSNDSNRKEEAVDPYAELAFECVEDRAEAAALRPEVNAAIARLPERWQLVIYLRYAEGLLLAQTAEMIGVSEGRVSQIQKAALAQLRHELRPLVLAA